jgi:hypothetical protein
MNPNPGTARAGDHAPDPVGVPVAVEELLTRPGFLLVARTAGTSDELRDVLGDPATA